MFATFQLKCSRRIQRDGKRVICSQPLIITALDGDFVYCSCRDGHEHKFTRQYFGRFIIVDAARASADFPGNCLFCKAELNPNADTSLRGTVICYKCQTQMLYNAAAQQWEIAEVR